MRRSDGASRGVDFRTLSPKSHRPGRCSLHNHAHMSRADLNLLAIVVVDWHGVAYVHGYLLAKVCCRI